MTYIYDLTSAPEHNESQWEIRFTSQKDGHEGMIYVDRYDDGSTAKNTFAIMRHARPAYDDLFLVGPDREVIVASGVDVVFLNGVPMTRSQSNECRA